MSTITENLVVDQVKIPIELLKLGSDFYVASLVISRTYFRDPFFIDSLAKILPDVKSQIKLPEEDELLARPVHFDEKDRRIVITPIETFISKHSKIHQDKKLGFIFHMSRCGSTLASQMLASSDRFFVLSEPTIINSILDPAVDISPDVRKSVFRSVINALSECAPRQSERVLIKFRSWNILFMNIVLSVFPDVSWVFIHRHGLEVLQSVLEKPPGWLRSKHKYTQYLSEILRESPEELENMSDDEYAVKILAMFCRIAHEHKSPTSIFLDYTNIKSSLTQIIDNLWHVNLNNNELALMSEVAKIYSKDTNKTLEFKSDSEAKRSLATDVQRSLVDKLIEPVRASLKL